MNQADGRTLVAKAPAGPEKAISTMYSSTRLTADSLALQNASSDKDQRAKSEKERIQRLQEAGRSLGFELPSRCFEHERSEMDAWLSVQRGRFR